MTNGEYITQKMAAFGINGAMLADIALSIDLDAPYTGSEEVGRALVSALEELLLQPYMSNVNENGFSVSWNRDNAGKWYLWLCKKYGVTPSDDVKSLLGISMVTDVSDLW